MNAGHRVTLSIDETAELFTLRTEPLEQPDIFSQHLLHVVRLQDQLVRAALVKLGWTPPEAKPPVDTLIVDWLEAHASKWPADPAGPEWVRLEFGWYGLNLRDAVARRIEEEKS